MNLRVLISTCFAALSPFATAQPHHGDIRLTVDDAIRTNDTDGPQRIFASELGAVVPDYTDEPGFVSAPGTFPINSRVGFRILDSLRLWDGASFETISSAPMELAFSTLSRTTPQTPHIVDGFSLPVGSNGEWHRHLEFSLLPPAGSGVYLLTLSLWSSDPAIGPSDPFWVVFGNGADAPTLDAAIGWVRQYLLPPVCDPDLNQDGNTDQDDVRYLVDVIGGGSNSTGIDPDVNHDGNADQDDLASLIDMIGGGGCP
ncbi:MAG: hypothetical protein DYG92_06755 [Leptolyngbya sp. PLA1]|nr:hypothetical protein [Leptolyngbya sp. PLA1]